uniref:HTH myb-type domain-containing protein n=1 Tax=Ananas comosus var. bracteatus TaxID=296719 RepID=A0A6V7Q9A2_ANACO|nr:unnamed protein product [Ananas comosus var. bracteatus]
MGSNCSKPSGRTDNEIKNYWRTRMRKKAQERKTTRTSVSNSSPSSSSSNVSSSNSEENMDIGDKKSETVEIKKDEGFTMDQIWSEIGALDQMDDGASFEGLKEGCCSDLGPSSLPSPICEYWSEALWRIDDEEYEILLSLPVHN